MMKSLKANGGFVNLEDDDGEDEEALSFFESLWRIVTNK